MLKNNQQESAVIKEKQVEEEQCENEEKSPKNVQKVGTCQECAFQVSMKLTQQIYELRKVLAHYQNQNKQLQGFSSLQQTEILKMLSPFTNALNKQFFSETNQQEQLKQLENQLQRIEQELQTQKSLAKQHSQKAHKLNQQFIVVQDKQFSNQIEIKKLRNYFNNSLIHKQAQFKRIVELFQRTNFISIFYSITFEDNISFLNGQKVTFQNCWKVIEILLFYHHKYRHYKPIVDIVWDDMHLQTSIQLGQEINSGQRQRNITNSSQTPLNTDFREQIKLCFDDEKTILQTWMPYILVQMKNIFGFLAKESGISVKLNYEVTGAGTFKLIQTKKFKSCHEKFNFVVKCLLSDIDQINKLELFAKEKRIRKT